MPTLEERLIELETRLAFQDDALSTLSAELLRQQRLQEGLAERLSLLQSKIDSAGEGVFRGSLRDEIPPHY